MCKKKLSANNSAVFNLEGFYMWCCVQSLFPLLQCRTHKTVNKQKPPKLFTKIYLLLLFFFVWLVDLWSEKCRLRWLQCCSTHVRGCCFPADLLGLIIHGTTDQSSKCEPARSNLRIRPPFPSPPFLPWCLTSSCLKQRDYQVPNDTVGARGRSDPQPEAADMWADCAALLTSGVEVKGSRKLAWSLIAWFQPQHKPCLMRL